MSEFDFTPEALENEINQIDEVDTFSSSIDYDKFLVLSKKDVADFLRLVDPLTKASVDDYGKSILISAQDDVVRLSYMNAPFIVDSVVSNKSGKGTDDFAVSVSTLKQLCSQAFSSIVIVQEGSEFSFVCCEQNVYLETKTLDLAEYKFNKRSTPCMLAREAAIYTFRKIGACLSLTDRASERTIVIKEGTAYFNTGSFSASVISPFEGSESFVLYKAVADTIATLSELSTCNPSYGIEDEILSINNGQTYIEVQIGNEAKVQQYLLPSTAQLLSFNATVQLINDNLLRLVSVIKSLDYLSDVVKLTFTDESLIMGISSRDNKRSTPFTFSIIAGKPEMTGDFNTTCDLLKIFLSIVGSDCRYSFTDNGLGIQTDAGHFLIRNTAG